ncbi:hypothetical protein [Deinococcus hohokamensis]|uniref:Uncharacterized protein n=1 Tax=Deinococcus hohokamensis TaxID=309883 RepID=A0ABV9IEA6_9DEIO
MSRARLLGGLLALILLGCAAVIVLDQQGAFGSPAATSASSADTVTAPAGTPAGGTESTGGYGDLK